MNQITATWMVLREILKWEPLSHSCLPKLEAEPSSKTLKGLRVTKCLLHHTFLKDPVCLKYKWIYFLHPVSENNEMRNTQAVPLWQFQNWNTLVFSPENFCSKMQSIKRCSVKRCRSNCTISLKSSQNLGIYSWWRFKKKRITFFLWNKKNSCT